MILNSDKYKNIYLLKTDGGNNSTELLTELGQYAVDNALATDGFVRALLKREHQYPTGIQASLGIANTYTIEALSLAALLDKPATFRSMGYGTEMKVEVVFMLLLNEENQVKVLSELVRFIQDEEKLKELYTENGLNCMYETFGKYL